MRSSKNPIYTGALGEYNGVILRESEFIPSSGTNLRHNVLLGQGAGSIAFGNAWAKDGRGAGGGTFFNWREETEDYGNEQGIAGISALGIKGSVFNSEAFGRIAVVSTDAAP